ncbi:MAG: hypothetical protein RIR77_1083 [Planctomycetota bacterium]|jgi:hypothetical protein
MPGLAEHPHLAAGAGEDRAALSGHPRKADADQYESVLHQGQHEGLMQNALPGRRRRRGQGRAQRPSS